uniref:Kinesin light chain n=2 Tax=Corethron hystrix TaxID=216773 RepID=A0A7S1BU54_9STRA|mmetsp:Transcript_41183/g.96595  ORF Transcript_41183/g.96595 Transcript_41183/m.96595 type:complete len:451 (+) Transcript_41183:189-1541(+)
MSDDVPYDEKHDFPSIDRVDQKNETNQVNQDISQSKSTHRNDLALSYKNKRTHFYSSSLQRVMPHDDRADSGNSERPFNERRDEKSSILQPIKPPFYSSRGRKNESRRRNKRNRLIDGPSEIPEQQTNVDIFSKQNFPKTRSDNLETCIHATQEEKELTQTLTSNNSGLVSFIRTGVNKFEEGRTDESLACFLKALKIQKDSCSPSSYNRDFYTAHILNNIGAVYLEKGQLRESLAALNESLILKMKNKSGRKSISCVETLNNIGNIYSMMGKNDEALNIFNEVLEIQNASLPHDDTSRADTHHNIGVIYYFKNDLEPALPHLQKALHLKKEQYGNNHLDVADTLEKIGAIYSNQKMFDDALSVFQEELRITIAVLGEDHPDVAPAYHNVGEVHKRSGNFPLALATYLRSYKIYRDAGFQDEHPSVLTVCQKIKYIRSMMISSNKVRHEF